MMRRGLVAGMLMLGGCIAINPMFVDSTTGTDASDASGTSGTTPTTTGSSDPTTGPGTTTAPMTTTPMGYCGDGQLDPGEECDDGDADPENGCSNDCLITGCGDGVLQAGELCDDGNLGNYDDCLDTCEPASCGDGYVQAGVELCDDGNASDADDCPGTCEPASCGDGFLHDGVEQCDDSNLENNDACLANCTQASCGDGVLWTGMEACDDGNVSDDDACRKDCTLTPPYSIVFVSSQGVTGKLGGVAGADKLCQTLADNAQLMGTFRAWLGDSISGPANRLYHAPTPYIRTDSVLVAKSWADLTDGTLSAPIDKNEYGGLVVMAPGICNMGNPVHSNAKKDGALGNPLNTCMDWTSELGTVRAGQLGPPGQFNGLWTDACDVPCSTKASIYCVQQ